MGLFSNFGDKLKKAANFGLKVINTGSKLGSKISGGFGDAARFAYNNADKILSLAESAPGVGNLVKKFDAPIRSGVQTIGEVAKLADMTNGVFSAVRNLTNRGGTLEKSAG